MKVEEVVLENRENKELEKTGATACVGRTCEGKLRRIDTSEVHLILVLMVDMFFFSFNLKELLGCFLKSEWN